MDQDDGVTQWTPAARDRYAAATAALLETLNAHTALVAARVGRQVEIPDYIDSAQRLQQALDALTEAEFDVCGSFPFSLREDDEDDFEPEDDVAAGAILTVEHRADFEILDEAALVEAGRAAYLTSWPDDVEEDARLTVSSPAQAVGQLIHTHGWQFFENGTDALAPRSSETVIEQDPAEPELDGNR
ncbi:hypothetical protein [Kineosporia mesophila]|uniref:hypothetical protein n=1 Tax=Kineosporia mesophila TaxID=566012 RepID=UPI001E5B85AD|nr:hypothetical protein [Kineosporia mesophila]MCD5350286.1 hypothetical protein [Kineosporia mesophila]